MKKFLQQKPLSTFDERLKKTPKDNPLRGYWTGKRGLSTYIPTSSQTEILEILHHYNLKGIRYTEAMPIFEKCSECTIQSNNMSILRWKTKISVIISAPSYGMQSTIKTSLTGQKKT